MNSRDLPALSGSTRVTDVLCHAWLYSGCWGYELGSSCWHSGYLIDWKILLAPYPCFIIIKWKESVCAFMCVCIPVGGGVHVHMVSACLYMCVCMCISCVCACTCVCKYMPAHVCGCACVCVCVSSRTVTHALKSEEGVSSLGVSVIGVWRMPGSLFGCWDQNSRPQDFTVSPLNPWVSSPSPYSVFLFTFKKNSKLSPSLLPFPSLILPLLLSFSVSSLVFTGDCPLILKEDPLRTKLWLRQRLIKTESWLCVLGVLPTSVWIQLRGR